MTAQIRDPHDALDNVAPGLHRVLLRAMTTMPFDVQVICTSRSMEAQQAAYDSGHSKAKPGQSAHDWSPSLAYDLAPLPIDWNDTARFGVMADHIKTAAAVENVQVVWGGDWKSIKDFPHFELKNWRSLTAGLTGSPDDNSA
jgi:peptidoglycan L-alanyl-D-glutamate endopeptidase CwlK